MRPTRQFVALASILAVAGCVQAPVSKPALPTPSAPPEQTVRPASAEPPAEPVAATQVSSARDAVRLTQNTGVTLQWIGWDKRGTARVTQDDGGVYRLSARQAGEAGGLLSVEGIITEIGRDYFILDGTIVISDTPETGRNCFADRQWRFEVTQDRKYYRMRTFEWCDRLTDYIDIYF